MCLVLKAKAQMFAAAKDFIEEEGIVTYLGAIDFTQKESSVFVSEFCLHRKFIPLNIL